MKRFPQTWRLTRLRRAIDQFIRRPQIPGRPMIVAAVGLFALGLQACTSVAPQGGLTGTAGLFGSSDTLSGNYLAARQAGRSQDTVAAAQYYARALTKRPHDRDILERAFLLDLSSGRIDSAVSLARRIVGVRPDDRLARLTLAVNALEAGANREARTHVDKAGDGPLTDLVNLLIASWSYAGDGRTDLAIARLSGLGQGSGLSLYRTYNAALIYDMMGQRAKARAHYEMAMDLSGGSSLRVVQAYGGFLERAGEGRRAAALYRAFLDEIGGHPSIAAAFFRAQSGGVAPRLLAETAQDGAAEAIYGLAGALAREEERALDLPIVYLHLVLHLRDDFPIAHSLLADILDSAGRHALATEAYGKVPRSSPLWANARIRIAQNLNRDERTAEAIDILKEVIEIAPQNVDVMASIGDLFQSNENFSAAAEYYGRAIAQVGDEPAPGQWILFYHYGIALERSGRWSDAEKALKKALDLHPDEPFVLNYLGYSWIDRGENLEEAMAMIRRAVSIEPDNGFIVDSLGWGLYQLGRYEDAVGYLERAVSLEPSDPVINDHLGDAYWRTGRRIEARFQWNHALDRDPEEDLEAQLQIKLLDGPDGLPSSDKDDGAGSDGRGAQVAENGL